MDLRLILIVIAIDSFCINIFFFLFFFLKKKVHEFHNKGRGVVTTRNFQRGEFVIEYKGDLISMSEANEREQRYAADDNTGCYMYYFKHNEQQYW
jgi:SET domain